jgi:hypothetical protein
MATGADVMKLLRPNQGWSIVGEDFLSIKYDDGVIPLTEKEFAEGFAKADDEIENKEALDAKAAVAKAEAKAAAIAKLAALGLTADEVAALTA